MNRVLIALALVLGCAAGAVLPSVVGRARAQTPPPPPPAPGRLQWEQMCVPYKDEANGNREIVKHPYAHAVNLQTGWNPVIAHYGAQGFELVAVNAVPTGAIGTVCFKRARQ